MNQIAKAIVAFFTALGTWGATALAADSAGVSRVDGAEWFGLCGVIVVTAGVWATPNTSGGDGQAGRARAATVLVVLGLLLLAAPLLA